MASNFDKAMVVEQALIGMGGIAGALVALRLRPARTVFESLTKVASGFLCAVFATPMAVYYMPTLAPIKTGVGFLIGLMGLAIAGGILLAVERIDFSKFIPWKDGK